MNNRAADTTAESFTLKNVETFQLQNNADLGTTQTIDLAFATGLSNVTLVNSGTAATAFTNVNNLVGATVQNTNGDLSIGYKSAVVSGTANSQTITLNGANTTTSGTVTTNGIETINVVTTGTASGSSSKSTTLASDVLQTVNVSGDQTANLAVDLSTYASTTKTGVFNASGATAAITAAITIAADDKLSVTGGAGNDVYTVNNLGNSVTVDGGLGVDTVKTSATALNQTQIANVNVENLNFTVGSTTLNLTGNANITGVGYEAGFGASTLAGAATGTTITTHAAGTSLGVSLGSVTPTNDTLNFVVGKTGATGSDGIAAGTITATGVEVMNFTSQAKTVPTTGATNTATVAGTSVDTVTVTGSTKFALTQSGGSIKSYDATNATGVQDTSNITFKSTGATVTGGSGNDILTGGAGADILTGNAGNDTITGGAGNDQLFGGAGNDSLIAGTGKDTLTGGDGADVFSFADGDSVSSNINTVTDFVSGVDRISVGQANTKFIGNFSDVDTALAAMTAVNQSFFVTTTNQLYVVAIQGTLGAADEVIKLTDVTELTSADVGLGSLGPGNDITLTNVSSVVTLTTNTNATAKSTNLDDTFYTLATYVAGTDKATLDGALGNDTLILSGAGGTIDVSEVTNIEVLDLTAATSAVNSGTLSTGFTTALLSSKSDTITASATATSITGGVGNDSITGGAGNDTVYGGAGNDTISGAAGTNKLYGDAGDDQITTSSGTDIVEGGAGNDTIIVTTTSATGTLAGGDGAADKLQLNTAMSIAGATVSGFETLQLAGGGSTNTLTIAQYNQFTTIQETNAATTDTLVFSGVGGSIVGSATVDVYNATALTSATTISAASATGLKILGSTVTGVANTLSVTGTTAAAVSVVGGGAADIINIALLGDTDTITGGAGIDTLRTTGNTTLSIGNTNLITLVENVIVDNTTTNVGWATKAGTIGDGTIAFTFDASALTTGALTFTAAADDGSTGNLGKVSVTGGAGDDNITGTAQADTINGGGGGDSIYGGSGNDSIITGSGNNLVDGQAGSDSINLTGGGNDNVRITTVKTGTTFYVDSITGFVTTSGQDVLGLTIGDLDDDTSALTLSNGAGADYSAAVAVGALAVGSLAANGTINIVSGNTGSSAFDVLKLTSTTANSMATALGTGTITIVDANMGATEGFLAMFYDSTNSQAVVGLFTNSSTTVPNAFVASEFTAISTIGMSSAEYVSFNASNLYFF